MKVWLAITLVAAVTFLERASFIVFLNRWQMPDWLVRMLRFVPVAVFPALIAPLFFINDGALDIAPSNLRLWAGLVAALVAWRSQSILLTITSGMITYWLLMLL